ncbi:MAG: hypothetical protein IJ137_08230 [Eubacterium sp.]|nr:hypothetical protein [Eubacterium sp.]
MKTTLKRLFNYIFLNLKNKKLFAMILCLILTLNMVSCTFSGSETGDSGTDRLLSQSDRDKTSGQVTVYESQVRFYNEEDMEEIEENEIPLFLMDDAEGRYGFRISADQDLTSYGIPEDVKLQVLPYGDGQSEKEMDIDDILKSSLDQFMGADPDYYTLCELYYLSGEDVVEPEKPVPLQFSLEDGESVFDNSDIYVIRFDSLESPGQAEKVEINSDGRFTFSMSRSGYYLFAVFEKKQGANKQATTESQDTSENQPAADSHDSSESQAATDSQDTSENQAATDSHDSSESQAVTDSQDTSENQAATESQAADGADGQKDQSGTSTESHISTENKENTSNTGGEETETSTESRDKELYTMGDDEETETSTESKDKELYTMGQEETTASTEVPDKEFYTSDIAKETEREKRKEANSGQPKKVTSTKVIYGRDRIDVKVSAPAGAFPEGTTMKAVAVMDESIVDSIAQAVDGSVTKIRALDITFYDADGNMVEPAEPVQVTLSSELIAREESEPQIVHLDEEEGARLIDQMEPEETGENVTFEADSFSIYALVYTVKIHDETGAGSLESGEAGEETYHITVTYTDEAEIPEGASLAVSEVLPTDNSIDQPSDEGASEKDKQSADKAVSDDSAETALPYEDYVSQAEDLLGIDKGRAKYIRLFDIKIIDEEGRKVQPAPGSSVDVRIELEDAGSDKLSVVHFAEMDSTLVENTSKASREGAVVEFSTEGFSVYAIVEAPDPVSAEVTSVVTLDELAANSGSQFYLSYGDKPVYFTSQLNNNKCFVETGDSRAASGWYFEPVGENVNNQYYIYTYIEGAKEYVTNPSGNFVGFSDKADTVFELSQAAEGLFYIRKLNQNLWLQHSNGGGGIRFYTDNNNTVNTRITLTYASSFVLEKDPYGLDGRTYGIAFHDDSVNAAALTWESQLSGSQTRLAGQDMLMRPDVLDNDGILLVANDSQIRQWTFRSISEDKYYLMTAENGTARYLTIRGTSVSLSDSPDETYSVITATPGTGTFAGKWHFTVGGYSLNLPSGTAGGFNGATGSGAATWMNLVEKSVLNDDDFNLYSARKVSVSDNELAYNGQQLILYTRIWNDTSKKYEFYAIDHDGSLIRCYDTGDNIEWIGSLVNTALWEFTEYTNEDGTLNYYYEFRNTQYGNYIAPQVSTGQILSDNTIGVNLNGRRHGENYTSIIAWDDENYAYSGLKTEKGHVQACALSEAEDFYFAVVNPADAADKLTTVETIDGSAYGISMKMIDFNNELVDNRDSVQHGFFGSHANNYEAGLLSTNLTDGYPTTSDKTGHEEPLSSLFTGMTDVNHLFIKSIYNESGYFEYDSTQNFAHLNEDGTFTVYNQLGAIGTSTGPTRTHGQFMPYNTISEGRYARDSQGNPITNQTDVLAKELPDTDPRKGEALYLIPEKGENQTDYFFGMEMSASFTQTASGLDAWGHDIIFEFSGDDDFWLYVDDELVLDLGGVRSAMTGSVNFRTGQVDTNGKKSTLYEVFRQNYLARGLSESQANARLADIFSKNAEGNYTFNDYSSHTMKMFYMERGAGASNLHMRFNLAAVRPGSFILSKKLSGTDHEANDLIEFPYQIWYQSKADSQWKTISDRSLVKYEGSSTLVRYESEYKPASASVDGTESGADALPAENIIYRDVFFLKPGQSAEVTLPADALDQNYYVVECNVNPSVYDHVYANGEELAGEKAGSAGRMDYRTSVDSLENRSEVDFVNHVSEGAMRTLSVTKRLYDTDGKTQLSYDDKDEAGKNETLFNFRLYLGNENTSEDALPLANLYSYYVKDAKGNYCRWDADEQRFVSLGVKTYADLVSYFDKNAWTKAQKETVIFKTSLNGSISKIPAGYTAEIRDLIVGTRWKVEERDGEIPKGYTRREGDGYSRTDIEPSLAQTQPIHGTMQVDEDPRLEIRNQKGWGLTVRKVWTDKDFMQSHDDIYFAVYLNTGSDLVLYPGSVRKLTASEREIYYFFDDLTYEGKAYSFNDFSIREVTVREDSLIQDQTARDESSNESDETSSLSSGEGVGKEAVDSGSGIEESGAEAINSLEEGETLTLGGTPAGGSYQTGYTYKVSYEIGQSTGKNENIRTDTVTNSRPGIRIYKEDWSGKNPLSGAGFTLTDESGANVGAASYSSGADGLVTIAYLNSGAYTLRETVAPKGYIALPDAMTITIAEDETISIGGVDEAYYTFTPATESEMAAIRIRNRPSALQVVNVDAASLKPLPRFHFALYRQVKQTDGTLRKDYLPMSGYEDLVTDDNGILTEVVMSLGPGSYYLTQTRTADGYALLEGDLSFTIGEDGTVEMEESGHPAWLDSVTDQESGSISYLITIPNTRLKKVSFKKVDTADVRGSALAGAEFDLYMVESGSGEMLLFSGLTSGQDGMLRDKTNSDVFELSPGTYLLKETRAPKGYELKEEPVEIIISDTGVTYDEGTSLSSKGNGSGLSYDSAGNIYTLLISNTAGMELPASGGNGYGLWYLLGGALILLAGLWAGLRQASG